MTAAVGKPRPAVIVQADGIETPVEIIICPFSTTLVDAPIYRLSVHPDTGNGLKVRSQLMVDKTGPAPRDRIGEVIGRLSDADLDRLDVALVVMLDLNHRASQRG